ncbi:MAG: VWA domain-containing protein [Candidatus Methanoperedens sp.]|nr:VWA domain-containing protein [Candidatus Methanoperedens sp.]
MDFPPQFASPLILLLISPVVLGGLYAIRRGVSKYLILSRVIILSLLIIALASPFTMGITTVKDDAPRITVLTDQTMSMDLFKKDTGQIIYEAIKSKTPTTFKKFAGMTSPVGDEVIGASENNNIVLVSDGNANYGKDLSDAITFVSKSGTRVFAVNQKLLHNDMSVEIAGAKNLILGNENTFNIVVRQAGNNARYRLDVKIDDKPVSLPESSNVVQTEKLKTIQFSYIFTTLGTHRVEAVITPQSDDWFPTNNKFYKAVYVVPKPKALVISDDTGSSLYQIVESLYAVDRVSSIPDDLSKYRVVIIDNMGAGMLGAVSLKNYVAGGGGLVVVGGDASYDKGNYNNSPVEAMLPIISRAAEYKGGRNIVIVIDASGSMFSSDATTGISAIGLIDANAINIVRKISRDSNVGIVTFGANISSSPLLTMSKEVNRAALESFIREITPSSLTDPTDLDRGLLSAEELLNSVSGTKEVIVFSDGIIDPDSAISDFEKIKAAALELKSMNIKMHFFQILLSYETKKEPGKLYNELAIVAGADSAIVLNPDERASVVIGIEAEPEPTTTETPEVTYEYPIAALESNHFITKYVNITASVTGYNDVTPKLGADRLVVTTKGKPIITTWGFGLGRVVAFTTDNGAGMTMWAPAVYSGENSRLVSGMINWAIGDPRGKEGVVVQAEDIWGGTPGRVIVRSNTVPQVQFDKKDIALSSTGPTTYETTINPDKEGFHDLSGYGIAVNYPIEYRDVGFNDELKTIIESNGGRVYEEDGVEGLLFMDIKEKATRTVEAPQSEKEPFLLAALILFLAEVIIRRIKDYRKDRPKIEDNLPRAEPVEAAAEGTE